MVNGDFKESSVKAKCPAASSNMSFVDETKHVKERAKVMKRNRQLNIRNTRLRKTLQNDKLLNNYFEFAVSNSEPNNNLTVYKIVDTTCLQQEEQVSNRNMANDMEETNRVVTSIKVPIKANRMLSNTSSQLTDNCSQNYIHSNVSNDILHAKYSNLTCDSNSMILDQPNVSIQNNVTCSNIGENVQTLTNSSNVNIFSDDFYSNHSFLQNLEYSHGNSDGSGSNSGHSLDNIRNGEEDLGFLTFSWFDHFSELLQKETNSFLHDLEKAKQKD